MIKRKKRSLQRTIVPHEQVGLNVITQNQLILLFMNSVFLDSVNEISMMFIYLFIYLTCMYHPESCLLINCQCPVEDLEAAAGKFMSSWIELATTPFGSQLDATKMFWPVAPPRKSHFKAAAKMRAVMLENESSGNIGLDTIKGTLPQERNGDASTNAVKITVGSDLEMSVTNTRVVTASALGIFASKLHEGSIQFIVDPLWNALTSFSGVQRQVAFTLYLGLCLYSTFFVHCICMSVYGLICVFSSGGIHGSHFLVQGDQKQGTFWISCNFAYSGSSQTVAVGFVSML